MSLLQPSLRTLVICASLLTAVLPGTLSAAAWSSDGEVQAAARAHLGPAIVPIEAKRLSIKNAVPDSAARARLVFMAKSAGLLSPAPGSADDPRTAGGVITVSGASAFTQLLPAAGWTLLGTPERPRGYRYLDAARVHGPCRQVSILDGKLAKASCAGGASTPLIYDLQLGRRETAVAVRLTLGAATGWCTEFGAGSIARDGSDARLLLGKDAAAPSVCPADAATADREAELVARVNGLRAAAAQRSLAVPSGLNQAARGKALQMCSAGAATPSNDPLVVYGGDGALAVDERVGVAALDSAIVDLEQRQRAALDAIWATWQGAPTLIGPSWDQIGIGQLTCGDGRSYIAMVLRALPAPGLHPDGKTWLFMGQEMGAVGGFPGEYDQGYIDYVGTPAGVTVYADLRFPFLLRQSANLGAGDMCPQCYLDSPAFDGVMLAIGLYLVDDLPNVVAGTRDANIRELGAFIRDAARPVFLRIGYEFDGSWNHYDPALYVLAFRRIMDTLQADGVTNVISVWQSSGSTTNRTTLLQWYPGDSYVDWIGYSYFRQSNPSGGIMTIARERQKPIMIAEATPQRNLSLGDPVTHWNTWFAPFFAHIHANADVIKAVAYINTRWFDQPAWGPGWGDSRVQIRSEIKANWVAEMQTSIWAPGDLEQVANTYVLTPHDLTPP